MKYSQLWFKNFLVLGSILCAGCDQSTWNDSGGPSPQGCFTENTSRSVFGGSETELNQYPQVHRLLLHLEDQSISVCTGSFYPSISDSESILVTAAHCVRPIQGPKTMKIELHRTGEVSTKMEVHPNYSPGLGNGFSLNQLASSHTDIAVVKFSRCQRSLVSIGSQPKVGDRLTLIGFGDSQFDSQRDPPSDRQERLEWLKTIPPTIGVTRLFRIIDEVFESDLSSSSTSNSARFGGGDSGGSVFDITGKVIGIASRVQSESLFGSCDEYSDSCYSVITPLHSDENRSFLEQYIRY